MLVVLFTALLATGCYRKESVDLLKTVAAESRTKPRVQMSVQMRGNEQTAEEAALQKAIEDRIEQSHIGRLVSSGTNAGYMVIVVEVENTADAITELRRIVQSAGVLERSSFKIIERGS